MPIQAPQWTDYLNCPVCCREFGEPPRSPVSLSCGHTICRHCLKHIHRKRCPFDQTLIMVEPEDLATNTALLQLAGYAPPAQPQHPPSIQSLPESDQLAYDLIVRSMEHLAVYLKYCGISGAGRLSRPMQRKLVSLLQCCPTDEEARGRTARAARSLAERSVTELILHHQNPQQVCANLWAAVRARGCQYLGPAMQEEVLKLVLLALEDGSLLSRKVLVMFVVQRLEPHFPQASKTSVGHVVQLLYRASCFKVSKRERDSSLMQLKEEFRSYESLRREHDGQIVQIAIDAGLRIAPDQWSALLYGDTTHKGHMQSIIDKLQTPQSFAQSIQELIIALQRTRDPTTLAMMNMHLDLLASIDVSPDAKSPSWAELAEIMSSLKEVVSSLVYHLQQQAISRDPNYNFKHPDRLPDPMPRRASPQAVPNPTQNKYKVSMCRDAAARSFCPRGTTCTFAHSEEELERYRVVEVGPNSNYSYVPAQPALQMYPRYSLPPPPHPHGHAEYMQSMPPSHQMPSPNAPPKNNMNRVPNYPPPPLPPIIHSQPLIKIDQNGMMIPMHPDRAFYTNYYYALHEDAPSYPEEYMMPQSAPLQFIHGPDFSTPPPPYPPPHYGNTCRPAYSYEELSSPLPPSFPTHLPPPPAPRERQLSWPTNNDLYNFEAMQNSLLCPQPGTEDFASHTYPYDVVPNSQLSPQNLPLLAYAVGEASNQAAFQANKDRRAVGADRAAIRNERAANHADNAFSTLGVSDNAFSNHGISDGAFSNHRMSDNAFSSHGISDNDFSSHGITDNTFSNRGLSDSAFSNRGISDNTFSNRGLSDNTFSNRGISDNTFSNRGIPDNTFPNRGISDSAFTKHRISDNAVSDLAFSNYGLSNHGVRNQRASDHPVSSQRFSNLGLSNRALSGHGVSSHSVSEQAGSDHAFSHYAHTSHGLLTHAPTNQAALNQGLSNQAALKQGLSSQAALNQALSNQALSNQALSNQALSNQALSNQALSNQALSNQALSNQALSNQALSNQAASNQAESDQAAIKQDDESSNGSDEELEVELQELIRRIDTEF